MALLGRETLGCVMISMALMAVGVIVLVVEESTIESVTNFC